MNVLSRQRLHLPPRRRGYIRRRCVWCNIGMVVRKPNTHFCCDEHRYAMDRLMRACNKGIREMQMREDFAKLAEEHRKLKEVAQELLDLYDLRNALGKALKDGTQTEEEQRPALLRYGKEKKEAWVKLRTLLHPESCATDKPAI